MWLVGITLLATTLNGGASELPLRLLMMYVHLSELRQNGSMRVNIFGLDEKNVDISRLIYIYDYAERLGGVSDSTDGT